ncbi:MAG: ferrous iron transport protein A [Betaproteobacteria bacterium]|nr:ferrous iron transport protein A [Betaproteobacteria bacterium]
MNLSLLKRGARAIVEAVEDAHQAGDSIAQRLRELGFAPGEPVSVLAFGPMGRDTMAVQIGFTRFALRRSEAARVRVSLSLPA